MDWPKLLINLIPPTTNKGWFTCICLSPLEEKHIPVTHSFKTRGEAKNIAHFFKTRDGSKQHPSDKFLYKPEENEADAEANGSLRLVPGVLSGGSNPAATPAMQARATRLQAPAGLKTLGSGNDLLIQLVGILQWQPLLNTSCSNHVMKAQQSGLGQLRKTTTPEVAKVLESQGKERTRNSMSWCT